MSLMWVETGSGTRTGFWAAFKQPEHRPDGGIGTSEWLNLDTGAGLLLVADGEWRTGGTFVLWYARPGAGELSNVSHLMWPANRTAFEQDDPNDWQTVKDRCTKLVSAMVSAQPLSQLTRETPSSE